MEVLSKNSELHLGDCVELMAQMPDGTIDLVVTDPPYLISYKTGRRKNKQHDFCKTIKGDNDRQLIIDYISECHRILKDNTALYMFCSGKTIDFFKKEIEKAGFVIKNIIVWVKNNHTAGDLKAQYGQQYEFIILANKGRREFNGKRLTDVWSYKRVVGAQQLHQNQKPVDLIKQCILKHSNPDEIVFDGFMGAGTTGVACAETGRRFVGIEIEPKYYDIAKERINNTYAQGRGIPKEV